jgi:hypothetical protein
MFFVSPAVAVGTGVIGFIRPSLRLPSRTDDGCLVLLSVDDRLASPEGAKVVQMYKVNTLPTEELTPVFS